MDLERLAIAVPAVAPTDSVAKAVARMKAGGGLAVVLAGKRYVGLLSADGLARSPIANPDKTTVGKYAEKVALIPAATGAAGPGLDVEGAVHALLVENHEAIPVRVGKEVRVVTKLALLGAVAGRLRDVRAKDVMAFPYCVHADEPASTALAMLRDLGVSRLPVVDDKDRILGAVDCLDLLAPAPAERRKGPERVQPAVAVGSLAHAPPIVSADARIPRVVEAMRARGKGYALVAEGDRIAGIVTPKRILKLLGEQKRGAYVNVSGLQGEDDFLRELVDKEIERHLRVVRQKLPVDQLILHCRTYAHGGKRKEYEVKARLITGKGFFFSQAVAWDLTKSVGQALGKIEKEVLKATDRKIALKTRRQRAARGP